MVVFFFFALEQSAPPSGRGSGLVGYRYLQLPCNFQHIFFRIFHDFRKFHANFPPFFPQSRGLFSGSMPGNATPAFGSGWPGITAAHALSHGIPIPTPARWTRRGPWRLSCRTSPWRWRRWPPMRLCLQRCRPTWRGWPTLPSAVGSSPGSLPADFFHGLDRWVCLFPPGRGH